MPRTTLLPALLGLLVVSTACDASGTGPSAEGRWGGQTASLQLAPAGGAIQYQCGAGTIDSGWTLSTRGTFQATGVHFFGGGPLPPGGVSGQAARYDVRVRVVKADAPEGDAAAPGAVAPDRSSPQFEPMRPYPGMRERPGLLARLRETAAGLKGRRS